MKTYKDNWLDSQELQQLNLRIAESAMAGKLNGNPLIQGLLVSCLRQLDKQGRGIYTLRGRKMASSSTESMLVEDACMTLALAGGHKDLAMQLGQSTSGFRLKVEELPEKHSLPNPCLSLLHTDHIESNLSLVDQAIPRLHDGSTCRLILGVDHTYLVRSFVQGKIRGEMGILGGPWSPSNPSTAFMPFSNLPENPLHGEKASLMLECLVWSPWTSKRQSLPIASMPMSLARTKTGYPWFILIYIIYYYLFLFYFGLLWFALHGYEMLRMVTNGYDMLP